MDLIALAIPGFVASMGYEAWWLKKRAQEHGPSPVDYELKDTVGSLAMGAGTASAAGHDWSGVAECESSGNWSANTGNGYQGVLQFSPSTWAAYGGTGNAANASQAEQVRVAENVLEGQGVGAWPVCGQHLTGGSTPGAQTAPVATEAPVQQVSQETSAVETQIGNYVVQAGDTLSAIAKAHGVSLDGLAGQVSDINMILVGQTINV